MKKRVLAVLCAAATLLSLAGCTGFKEYFYLGDPKPPVTQDAAGADAPSETPGAPAPSRSSAAPDTTEPPAAAENTDPSGTEPTETVAPTDTTAPQEPTSDVAESTTQPPQPGYTSKGYKIEQKDGFTYINGVLIVNKTYSIPASYAPGDLTPDCSSAFAKLQNAASQDGISIYSISGYRSYQTQTNLYNRYCARDGQAAADTYSARPGHSEHQTGLAIDVNSLSHTFADTAEGKWLAANAHKFGFIIRYTKDKQSVTGYAYEPWHIRYIGDLAEDIYNSGLCLEEYFGITSVYS